MKKILFFCLLISAISVQGQSLKDALYGGKLRLDSGAVIRKGDDLSTKIDTSTRKPVEKPKPVQIQEQLVFTDSLVVVVDTMIVSDGTPAVADLAIAAKDNNTVWKNYMTEFISTLNTEVMTSKKIKTGSYSILVDYVIETDGSVTVNTVSSSPGNEFLEQQIKNRLLLTAPQMTPLLSANGKPRKAAKKHTFTVMKN